MAVAALGGAAVAALIYHLRNSAEFRSRDTSRHSRKAGK